MIIKWEEKTTAHSGQQYFQAEINGRTASIYAYHDGDRGWWEMDVDGCTEDRSYDAFSEAEKAAIKLANRTIHVRVTTTNEPKLTHTPVSGWGDKGECTTLSGDVGEIEIEVNEQERYSLRVEEGRVILTTYNRPLYMMLPTNLHLETDARQFSRMRNSVQHQDEMLAKLKAKIEDHEELWRRIEAYSDHPFSEALVKVYKEEFGEDA